MAIPNQRRRGRCRPIGRKNTHLPIEILEQILLKIPTKSLLRLKSVSKQWLSLVSDPTFVRSHLKHVSSDHLNRKITFLSSDSSLYSLNYDGNNVHKYNLPLSAPQGDDMKVLGSCNGLLCLGNRSNPDVDYNLILWNPLFNEYKQVPYSIGCILGFGFGYDSYTDDYKFVRLDGNTQEAEVYTLKSSSRRSLPFGLPSARAVEVGKVMNGSIYWMAWVLGSGLNVIEFNLRYEQFRLHKFPDDKVISIAWGVAVVRDCLGIFFHDFENHCLSLLTMKEDSVNGISWSVVKIQYREANVDRPLCLMMNGEVLMGREKEVTLPENDLIIYNPELMTVKNIAVHGAGNWNQYNTYIETLVSPS